MLNKIYPPFVAGRLGWGLLVLRLIAGAALMQHGWPKIQDPMDWMDKMPVAAPGIFQALAALAEFGGGLALILGLLTPLAALGLVFDMGTALFMVHFPHHDPWVSLKGPSFEPALGYLSLAVTLIFTGPGALSLDAMLFGPKPTVERTPHDSWARPVAT